MNGPGTVYLVGGGPGNPGLLTVRGKELLQTADVVVYDRLVGEEILSLIPPDAEKINVGKNAGCHPVAQEQINQILLEQARLGRRVVRLKGGDSFVFGRGGEELELLAQEHIPFEVVPGVTSAIAAPAFAGIPVTHRDYCSSVHIITGHRRQNGILSLDYEALVRLKGTLVFLMSVSSLAEIAAGLQNAGMAGQTPCAVVENGALPEQRKIVSALERVGIDAQSAKVVSPAVFVVGGVCGLSDSFDWYSRLPLKGLRFLVTSPNPNASRMAEGLRKLGARVLLAPAIRTEPLAFRLPDFSRYTAVVFTSAAGVSAFWERLDACGKDARVLAGTQIFCVGKETAKALRACGIRADFVPSRYSGEFLAIELLERRLVTSRDRVLLLRAETASPDLPRLLQGAGIPLEELTVYRAIEEEGAVPGPFDYAVFTSASGVEHFCKRFNAVGGLSRIRALCIGEQTAGAARLAGMTADVSPVAAIDGMLAWIAETLGHQ